MITAIPPESCDVIRRGTTTGLLKAGRTCLGKKSLLVHRDQDFARFMSESDENTQHSLDDADYLSFGVLLRFFSIVI